MKLSLYVGLGLVSLGILAGVAAVLARHRSGAAETAGDAVLEEEEDEIVGEVVTAVPESAPAT